MMTEYLIGLQGLARLGWALVFSACYMLGARHAVWRMRGMIESKWLRYQISRQAREQK